ncbi:MAG: two-component sensor histidine kinase [Deltaproteobacteria bacterium]|nr:two-component sensor histidine kinase [Deltaproteobacteria bacterium]MBW1935886.1 two-component sensor histidine kinase [Deltaproteobacteria bacterium]RLB39774.1 MAG: two-component sensor histidine kinase [Deltaproteobacteria bacterium]
MNNSSPANSNQYKNGNGTAREGYYRRLFRRFILLTLLCSLIPLLLVGWGINNYYTRFARNRMMLSFHTKVENHRKIIELFLKNRVSGLQVIAKTHPKEYLVNVSNLAHVFDILNSEYRSITDLGVIDERGRHLAYIGPYNLMDKNYSKAFWFKEVMKEGVYISDMFMGFRKVPHFIVAVTRSENGRKWILRATIDTESFRSLVENVRIGKTGEVYLLNRSGIYQTSPRFSGKIMEKASQPLGKPCEGIEVRMEDKSTNHAGPPHPRQLIAFGWLKQPQWMLVVRQDYSEAFNDVNHANLAALVFLVLSACAILIVAVFITSHMIKIIKKRDLEADGLNKQLMQAGKLASVGELSAGVAHEINNPLAIILTERQILMDLAKQSPLLPRDFMDQFNNSMSQIDMQIQRCKRITENLLRFSRRTKSVIEPVDLNEFLCEVINLMEREARSGGIKFLTDLEEGLQTVLSDPSQLQQVFLNIITNAIDAHEGKPYGSIRIRTRNDSAKAGVSITFEDTGCGISPKNLERIFDPFFTTKQVGRGTGLGLSICYSTVKRLGGDITVESELGKGTQFTLFFPYNPPADLQKDIEDVHTF